ncbi:hypothetical protein AB1Y20_017456 [Prymnesium parvum]|uniref:Uncharacterized protein n=1 Tax=Prymnesium parvum TaxID=97485 RepID=A0AB34JLC1_PRYPA
MDAFQLCLNGRGDDLAAALDADPTLLDRPQQGGLYDSRTLLHCAASKGHALVVQMLLSRGAQREAVDKRGQTALALAQKLGHHEIEQLLLGAQDAGRAEAPRRAEDGEGEQRSRANDRMGAEKRGRAEEEEEEAPEKQRRIAGSMETHTTAPLPVSEPRPLAREGTGKRRLSPLSDHATDSPAAKRATGSIAHEFPPGMDPFQLCLNGKTAELAVMLDVDPGLVHRTQEGGLYDSRTLLHCAAAKGRAELVALLLERGADPAAVEKRGHTAASLARKLGHISVVQLLERGAPAEGLTSRLRPSALAFTPRQPPWSSSNVSERQAALPAAAAVASRVLESSSPVTLARFDSADYAMSREAKKKWSAPPPAAHAAPCDSKAPAASAPEAPPAAHPDSMASAESATDVRVHVHECTAADRPPFASPAGALTLSRVVHKAETTSMDDVIEALRKEHCLTAIREPKDASGQLVPGATDVFTAWLNHADATDGSFDSDLHVWCLVDRPGPDGDHTTIYDILTEEADSLDDSS